MSIFSSEMAFSLHGPIPASTREGNLPVISTFFGFCTLFPGERAGAIVAILHFSSRLLQVVDVVVVVRGAGFPPALELAGVLLE